MNKLTFILTACFLSLIFPLSVSANIPMMLNYQGYVEDSDELPIDGNVFLKFSIVNEAGNVTYWSNDGTGANGNEPTNAVPATANNGIFSIKLGDSDLANMDELLTDPFENQDIYVRVWFSENNITFEQLTPDTQIVSTGFAYKAQSLVNGISWDELTGIPDGFDDGTDDGITSETDPTITENSIKDGVSWDELAGIPPDFADGIDNIGSGSETDPVFSASAAAGISGTNITNWNTAYSWGNHSSQGYLTSETGDITAVNSGEGTKGGATSGSATIEFDCSEVAGSGVRCDGEDINVYSLSASDGSPDNAVYVDTAGKVGIGTTSPNYQLEVVGDLTVSENLRVWESLRVTGMIYKDGGGFKIDHPLDPENKYLYHSFVESPDMKNIYDGVIELAENGEAWIELPDWFETLNCDFRYQLTPIGVPGPNLYIAEEVSDNRFKIAGGDPGMKVSWQVTGTRQDPYAVAHPIVPEEDKSLEERGYYLHPELYGQPEEMRVE